MTDEAEARFRAQAAALAQALRQSDEQASSSNSTAADTYRQLCFDDPVVSADDCEILATALVSNNNKRTLALSNRLQQGVAQLSQRRGPPPTDEEANQKESLLQPTTNSTTTSAGYSLLAWTIHGHLPLLLLMSDHLEQASAWIGSFRAPETFQSDKQQEEEEEEEAWQKMEQQQATEETSPVNTPVENNNDNNPNDNDSLQEEVWAAESDPSDYDFGTQPDVRLAELESAWSHLFSVEPDEVSQPRSDTSWLHVADALTFLLQGLKYSSVLAGIGMPSWKRWKISEKLTQITLTLLLPFTLQSTPLLSQYPQSHWQQLALQPLHAFRDAVDEQHALLEDYVNLLVLLVQAHHAAGQTKVATTGTTTSVAPATLVGLGALSTLCHSALEQPQQKRLQVVRETILRVSDDLTTILETTVAEDPVLPWTFLSLWHVLTYSHGPLLRQPQAQTLLQSGLVRQWMLTWQGLSDGPLRTEMERSLLHLVCVAPTTIGKYAWRFVNFAAHVTDASAKHAWDDLRLLWNLVGSHLAELAGGSALVSLKKTAGAAPRPAPSASTCRQQAAEALQQQCQGIAEALSAWKDRRNEATGEDLHAEMDEDTKQILDGFHAVVESMSIPLVRQLFLDTLVNELDVTATLAPIRKLLVSWPSPKSHQDTKENVVDEQTPAPTAKDEKPTHDDDDDDDVSRPKRRLGRVEMEDEMVSSLRKSIKILQSALESAGQATRFSSKAD